MSLRRRPLTLAVSPLVALSILFGVTSLLRADEKSPQARWEPAIRKFEQADEQNAPPKNAVLFVGSSSIRMWDLEKSFPELKTINRGFGGSQIADSTYFADRIVTKHEPRTIVLYAGDNDVAAGKSPQRVHADFRAFVKRVRQSLPKAKIVFIAIKPSIKRWNLVETMREANALIAAETEKDASLSYVDVDEPMLGDDGTPREELFAKDGLHLNEKGYALWTRLVREHLE